MNYALTAQDQDTSTNPAGKNNNNKAQKKKNRYCPQKNKDSHHLSTPPFQPKEEQHFHVSRKKNSKLHNATAF